jgi:hypothetical protein
VFVAIVVAVDLFYMKLDVLAVKILTLAKTKFALTGL